MEALHVRVAQLERSLRRQRATSLVVIVALSVAVLSAAAQQDTAELAAPIAEHLKVRKLTIVDAEGNPLIDLGEGRAGGTIQIRTPGGRMMASLGSYSASPGTAILELHGAEGDDFAFLEAGRGSATLMMSAGPDGKKSSLWTVADSGGCMTYMQGGGIQGLTIGASRDEATAGGMISMMRASQGDIPEPDSWLSEGTHFYVGPDKRLDWPSSKIERTSD